MLKNRCTSKQTLFQTKINKSKHQLCQQHFKKMKDVYLAMPSTILEKRPFLYITGTSSAKAEK